jgi:hypothetical protein
MKHGFRTSLPMFAFGGTFRANLNREGKSFLSASAGRGRLRNVEPLKSSNRSG